MENVNENIFWYLYELQSPPDVNNPPKDNDLAKSGTSLFYELLIPTGYYDV